MKTSRRYLLRLSALCAMALLAAIVLRETRAPDPIDRIAEQFLATHAIAGAVFGIAAPGKPLDLRAYGLADPATGRVMQGGDVFRLASLSKPVTAAAVMALLAQDAQFDMDTLLVRAFPDIAQAQDQRMRQISLRHLLQHSAGWDRDQAFDPFFLTDAALKDRLGMTAQGLQSCDPLADAMLGQPLQSPPGLAYAYSNLGYCWLGRWLAQVSGESYEAVVRRLVPEAAGLSLDLGDVTVVHEGVQALDPVPAFTPAVGAASGGWIGNAASYLTFATGPVHPATFTRPSFAGPEQYYGLGWRVWERPHGRLLTHYGAMPGVFSGVIRGENGAAIVMLFNGRPAQDALAFSTLLDALAPLPLWSQTPPTR